MRVLAAQINPTVGDLPANEEKIIAAIKQGRENDCDLVIFPELALTGYPPEDLILLPHFIQSCEQHLQNIKQECDNIAVAVGVPRAIGKRLCNSCALIRNKKLEGYADKILLPTYDVFDERRYFESGEQVTIWEIDGQRIGITICEDLWQHAGLCKAAYSRDPVKEIKKSTPELLINLSASPYHAGKWKSRLKVCQTASNSLSCPVILCNQVGGNDSLIFDGMSLYVTPQGLLQSAKAFEEEMMIIDLNEKKEPLSVERNEIEDLYSALVLGVRDYFHKLGFKKALVGLSGGIDSAVALCIATAALDKNVLTLAMPSQFSAKESERDAHLLAKRLGVECRTISIEQPFESFLSLLKPHFGNAPFDVTEENIQARIRGMLLMAFSNKQGYVVLSTGNKSELALGYCTLYGDMCGGLAVLGDITKEKVYALAHWINRSGEIIPEYTLQRPPSAELRPGQKDSDSLPDYAIIDKVVEEYVEGYHSAEEIAKKANLDVELVRDLIVRIHANEYKRRQAPLALRVSEKAFSVGRRFPIVQGWT